MEATHQFKIYYDKKFVCSIISHTKWEAIDRAFYKYVVMCPTIVREKFKAKMIF